MTQTDILNINDGFGKTRSGTPSITFFATSFISCAKFFAVVVLLVNSHEKVVGFGFVSPEFDWNGIGKAISARTVTTASNETVGDRTMTKRRAASCLRCFVRIEWFIFMSQRARAMKIWSFLS